MIYTPPSLYNGHNWNNLRIGILGGSFNPAHAGHRHISMLALKNLGLDVIWWMVSPQNPIKSTKDMMPFAQRLQSALDISNHPHIVPTNIEQQLGSRYTADTLPEIQKNFPGARFVWLMGTDNLRQIHLWDDWHDIFKSMPVCVIDRPPRRNIIRNTPALECYRRYLVPPRHLTGHTTPALSILHTPLNALSSTAIRAARQRIEG